MKKTHSFIIAILLTFLMLLVSGIPALAASSGYCISKVTSANGETLATMKLEGKTLTVDQNSEAKYPYFNNRLQSYITPTSNKYLYNLRILAGLGNNLGSYTSWMLWEPVYSGKVDEIIWNESDGVSKYVITVTRDSSNRISSLKYLEYWKYSSEPSAPRTEIETYKYSNNKLSEIQSYYKYENSEYDSALKLAYSGDRITKISSASTDEYGTTTEVIDVSYNDQGLVKRASLNKKQSSQIMVNDAEKYESTYSYNSDGYLTRWQGYLRDMKIRYDTNGCIARTDESITPSHGGGDTWVETYVFAYAKY